MIPARVLLLFTPLAVVLAAEPWERPVGFILSVSGQAFIVRQGVETQLAAAPGVMLFSGEKIRSAGGAVQFAFCPSGTAWTQKAGHEVTLETNRLRDTTGALQSLPPPSFCELPFLLRSPQPSGGSRGQSSTGIGASSTPPLSLEAQASLIRKLDRIDAALVRNPADLAAKLARAAALQELGRDKEFASAMQSIVEMYSAATYSRGFKHEPPAASETPSQLGKAYALLVGISHYKYAPIVPPLQYADKDAELFAEFLASPRGGALMPDQIQILRNGQATRAGVDLAIRQLAKSSSASQGQNTLILFVAAHGGDVVTEVNPKNNKVLHEEPYILTFETNPQDPNTSGYPMAEFARMVAREAGLFHRVLVFVDVCHANMIGSITSGRALEPDVRKLFAGKTDEFGMLLAAQDNAFESDYFSDSSRRGHGVFTFFVIDGWNGAASPDGHKVQFVNLRNYVDSKVAWATNDQQTPDSVTPSPNLVLVESLESKQRIPLMAPEKPLPESVTRRARKAPPRDVGTIAEEAANPETARAARNFEDALANGILLPSEPGNAIGYLDALRADSSVPASTIALLEDRLRAALEDKGQETILRYLEGDQIPQKKADFDRGGDYFEQALKLAPDASFDESRMLFCRGRALIFDHAYDRAQPLLERSIRLDPMRGYAYNALGIAYLEQIATSQGATFDQAIRAFHDAIRFAPDWAYPRHNLALAYGERGDYGNAQRAYAEAMQIAPHYSYLPYNLALLHQKLNEYGEADRDYRAALEIAVKNKPLRGPVNGGAWKERSVIYNAMGSLDTARGRWSKAEEEYRQARADDPSSVNARHNLALLLSRNGPSTEAEQLWWDVLKDDPDNLPALFSFADYLARNGDPNRAVKLYRCALNLRPSYPGGRRKLAELLAAQGNLSEALAELRVALGAAPDAADLWELAADWEARMGDALAARRDWRKAADLTKDRAGKARIRQKSAGK